MDLLTVALLAVEEVTAEGGNPLNYAAPILSTGVVGVFLLMIIFRIKIMPTYVYEDAKAEWERERAQQRADTEELKRALDEANKVYTSQVIPTLTRILDNEKELVALRRAEQDLPRRHRDASS